MAKPVSLETRQLMSRAHLSRKQLKFVEQYAALGNATEAARRAGYKNTSAIHTTGWENLRKPAIASAIKQELAKADFAVTPVRVQRRLHDISMAAQDAGQFGPAVRAEELLGKSIGLFIDRSIQLSGQMNDAHIAALLETAKRRQAEPVELEDDETDT
jgi:hypothetical protein